ncbi:MAG TPA: metallophosphoesterase, partial [Anaerolineae bacterium]|nr:metallophosphoesterase [Anaerolineae bacterium]
MRIGLIADTHVPEFTPYLPPTVHEIFTDVDLILHAGDITGQEVLDELSEIAPTLAVRGDHDLLDLPRKRVVEVEKCRIGLVHGDRPRWKELPGTVWNLLFGHRWFLAPGFYVHARRQFTGEEVDCVVCGHVHHPFISQVEGVLVVNPGSTYLNLVDQR